MVARNEERKCITKGCGKKVRCRGLCESCYFSARKLVLTKQVPGWSWLVKQGLALAEKRSPFMRAVKSKLKSKSVGR